MKEIALKLFGIDKSYSGVKVLHGIDIEITKGEVHGLVGENGAGKSTLMNIIGGVIAKDSGYMQVFGANYEPNTPASAIDAGIAFVHQEPNLFSNLTVAENMFIEAYPVGFGGAIKYKQIKQIAQQCIDEYELPVTPDIKIEELSTGVKQMIEISKALMKSPRIMIFDEPTTSLSSREKDKLLATINDLKERGITIIYISHILDDVFRLCDRISVLRDGHIIETSNTGEVTKSQVVSYMVGREMNQEYPRIDKEISEEIVLEARGIRFENKVRDVSLSLHKGEIAGLYGLMGSGRTELVKTLFGVEKMDQGEVFINGRKLEKITPKTCIQNHMAFVTEDRHHEGLLLPKSVAENLIIVTLPKVTQKLGIVNRLKEKSIVEEIIKNLRIKVNNPQKQNVINLSGGNQQKVVLGKWVINKPNIFILDEPTRGVDVGAKYEIYTIIAEMAKNGAAIFIISSEMEELIGICDRILVMRDGQLSGSVAKGEYKQETIGALAL